MPMSPRGHTGTLMMMDGAPAETPLYDPHDQTGAAAPYEAPQSFRRRVLPLVDAPQGGPSMLQQLTAMLGGGDSV